MPVSTCFPHTREMVENQNHSPSHDHLSPGILKQNPLAHQGFGVFSPETPAPSSTGLFSFLKSFNP